MNGQQLFFSFIIFLFDIRNLLWEKKYILRFNLFYKKIKDFFNRKFKPIKIDSYKIKIKEIEMNLHSISNAYTAIMLKRLLQWYRKKLTVIVNLIKHSHDRNIKQ